MNLSLNQQIGQLMMIGWSSPDPTDIIESIKRNNFGNVILFTRNIVSPQQVIDMCGKIQETAIEYNGMPAFISIDQEGGSVRRMYSGITNIPGNMAVSASENTYPSGVRDLGNILGSELKSMGINLNLAPVTDINSNPFNPIIAVRSYSDNPSVVSRLAQGFAMGMQEKGVVACYKHFIGHGDVDIDSHLDIPRVHKTLQELRACELVPYLNPNMPDAIMSAHILYPSIDDKFPATISYKILQGILRDTLNYQGLIITDCFEMDGLMKTFSLEDAAVYAVNASCDMICVSHSIGRQQTVLESIKRGVSSGAISQDTVTKALKRIKRVKEKYCTASTFKPTFEENQRIAKKISEASITLVSGEMFPIDSSCVCVGVNNTIGTVAEDKNKEKCDVAKSIGEKFGIDYMTIGAEHHSMHQVINFAKGKKIILCLTDSHLTLSQKVLYSALHEQKNKIMLCSMRTPYDVLNQNLPDCHIATYEYTSMSIDSLLKVLGGDKPLGKCPVRLELNSYVQTTTDRTDYLTSRIIKYIEYNYSRKLNLTVVADEFLLSEGHISKIIKKKTGKNFISLLNEIRIKEAKQLLNTTNLRINEVAVTVGYGDYNYFTRVFKQICGITPAFYRNNATKYD